MNRINRELLEASRENNLAEIRRLLSVGAEIEAKGDDGHTLLHWASRRGHSQVVIELLDHGAQIEAKGNDSSTPLHLACYNGHVTIVNELLSRGANTEAKDRYGDTPLHDASRIEHVAIVKALRNGGANLLAVNNQGLLPIHIAVNQGRSIVSKYLLQHFYEATRRLPLHKLLEDFTWNGDPKITSPPPLQTALRQNVLGTDDVLEILEYLVDQNPAMLSSRDQGGSLPLHTACRRGASFAIVESLVNLDQASVKSMTPQGDLPLFLACEKPETSLDSIFLLMKLYPDLVYR
jgi:ankyrin repeat protein